MLLNRDRLAEMLGCSLRTVDEYHRQGMPGDAPKRSGDQWKFESGAVVEWLRERERQNALGEIARVDETEAKRRKLAAEAGLAELELAKAEGSALSIHDFSSAWAGMIGAARAKLLGLGSKLGPVVAITEDAAECNSLIDAGIGEALQELSEFSPEIQDLPESDTKAQERDPEGRETVGAPAGTDGKRVGGRGKKAKQRIKRGTGQVSDLPN